MICQGNLYHCEGYDKPVIALDEPEFGIVRVLVNGGGMYPAWRYELVEDLKPAPMRYYGGEIPK